MKYVWIVFTLYFVVLSIYHLRKSRQIIGPFKNRAEVKTINDKSIGILEFTEDFNEYLARVNKENKTNNIISCSGDLLAALTTLISYFAS